MSFLWDMVYKRHRLSAGVVCRPMDLSTIKKNIDSGMIRTTAEFQRDMMLMFINAMMYNNVEHDVHKMAVEMYSDVMMHIEVRS